MKKARLLLACLLSLSCTAQNMTTVFGNMPKNLILLVDSTQRQDLMDLVKEGVSNSTKDKLNGKVTLARFGENFMELKSGNSSLQIALLSLVNDSKIVCMIQTVCAPVCDSRLSFYTSDWKVLDTSSFIQLAETSWFIKDDVDKNNEDFINAAKSLDMDLMQYNFNPENLTLTQTYTTPLYLSKEAKEEIEPFLKKESKVFEWKKLGFK